MRPGSSSGPPRGGRDAATIRNRRKRAAFPTGKSFESWRDTASTIPAATQQALRALEWVRRAESLAVVGPSGTGKSHLLEALGNAAIDDGLTVAWFTIESLGRPVRPAAARHDRDRRRRPVHAPRACRGH